ncbi:MAG: heavy metal-associated domain-containing protein [Bacteroidota bacterium]
MTAQFTWAQIGVNGLTCSQCTRSVEMSIRKLPFVQDVEMNLENTEGKIIFKKDAPVEFDKIAKAVTDAGFALRYLKAAFIFETVTVADDSVYSTSDFQFHFIKIKPQILNGETTLTFIGSLYMPNKELAKWKAELNNAVAKKGDTYFVTL